MPPLRSPTRLLPSPSHFVVAQVAVLGLFLTAGGLAVACGGRVAVATIPDEVQGTPPDNSVHPAVPPNGPVPPSTPAPKVWITSPSEGATVAGNDIVVATALASSAAGIASVQIIEGGWNATTTQASPYTASFVPSRPGALTIVAKATDRLGQVSFSTPVNVTVTGVAHSLTAGNFFTCDALGNNNVQCWGDNSMGQLGSLPTGAGAKELSPMPVPNLGSSAAIDARGDHTCVLDVSGSVSCWGINDHGQLGDNSTTSSPTPVQVFGITGATAIAVGDFHSCAVIGGTVMCWGSNSNGQLGNGAHGLLGNPLPVQVSGISNAVALALGQSHTCALLSDATVKCWGYNGFGQLGAGTFIDTSTPTSISNLSGVSEIACGALHTCARQAGGSVFCWGDNGEGQVGNNDRSLSNFNTPQAVSGLTTAMELRAGGYHTCARLSGSGMTATTQGSVVCWGYNGLGQLGNGSSNDALVPTAVSNITDAVQLGAGLYHSCALTVTNHLECWGNNDAGQLGNGSTTSSSIPVQVQFAN